MHKIPQPEYLVHHLDNCGFDTLAYKYCRNHRHSPTTPLDFAVGLLYIHKGAVKK